MSEQRPVVDWQPEPTAPSLPGSTSRSSWNLAQAAVILIGLTTLDYVVDGLLSIYGIGLLSDLDHVTDEQLIAYDGIVGLVALIGIPLFILSGIVFLAWQRRTIANLPALSGVQPTVSPNMSVVWWFVPFANLVKVPQIIGEALRLLAPEGKVANGRIVTFWWLSYLLAGIIANVYGRLPAATTVEEFNAHEQINIAADVFYLVAGLLVIRIILRSERWSRARIVAIRAAPGPEANVEPALATAPPTPPEPLIPQVGVPEPVPASES